jgi:hypothetical protein
VNLQSAKRNWLPNRWAVHSASFIVAVFVYRSRFLTRGEVWFDDGPDGRSIDWVLYRQCSRPIPKSAWRFFYTRLIDLSKSPEQLLAEMKDTTVAKIRQATEQDRTCIQQ